MSENILNPNTGTFYDLQKSLIVGNEEGRFNPDDNQTGREKQNIFIREATEGEYGLSDFLKAQEEYYKDTRKFLDMKKEIDSKPWYENPIENIFGYDQYRPEALREGLRNPVTDELILNEEGKPILEGESVGRRIAEFPTRIAIRGVQGLAEIPELGKMILPETVTKPIGEMVDEVEKVAKEFIPEGVQKAVQATFDPVLRPEEKIIGEIGALLTGTGVITKTLTTVLPKVPGFANRTAAFIAADLALTSKDENISSALIKMNPTITDENNNPYYIGDILETLAIDENDSDAIKLLKKAGEAGLLGIAGEAIFKVGGIGIKGLVKGYKSIRGKNTAIANDALNPPKHPHATSNKLVTTPEGDIKTVTNVSRPVFLPRDKKVGRALASQEIESVPIIAKPLVKLLDVIPDTTIPGFKIPIDGPKYKQFVLDSLRSFGSRQGLDKVTHRALERREATVSSARTEINKEALKFEREVKKAFGKPLKKLNKEEIDLVNKGIGKPIRADDPSLPKNLKEQSKEVTKIFKKNTTKRTVAENNIVKTYLDDLASIGRKEQADALNRLPEAIKPAISRLRNIIDNQSEAIQRGGLSHDLNLVVDSQKGLYVTAEYELISNPKYVKALRNLLDPKTKEKAIQTTDEEIVSALNETRLFFKKNMKGASDDHVDRNIEKFINVITDVDEKVIKSAKAEKDIAFAFSKSPIKGEQVLTRRIELAPEIRKIMKEVDSPLQRFSTTSMQQANIIAEQNFISDIQKIAASPYGKLLFENGKVIKKKDGSSSIRSSKFSNDLSDLGSSYLRANGPKNVDPLQAIFTSPQYKKALQKGLDVDFSHNPATRFLSGMNSWVSGVNTVGSEATHLINVQGNFVMMAANGHFMTPIDIIKLAEVSPGLGRLVRKGTGRSKEINDEVLKEARELGIIEQNVSAELVIKGLDELVGGSFMKGTERGLMTKGAQKAAELYRAEDAAFKLTSWFKEIERYRAAFPQLKGESGDITLKTYAAEVVKDTMPTYSRLGRYVKGISRVGALGVFPSFFVESLRTLTNIPKIAFKDIARGTEMLATGSKGGRNAGLALQAAGLKRLAGLTATGYTGERLFTQYNQVEHGITPDTEKFIGYTLPVWDQSKQLQFLRPLTLDKKGRITTTFINAGMSNPYVVASTMAKLSTAYALMDKSNALSPKSFDEFILSPKALNLLLPVVGPSLSVQLLSSLASNVDQYGNKIITEDMSTGDKVWKITQQLSLFIPTTIRDITKRGKELESERLKNYPNMSAFEFFANKANPFEEDLPIENMGGRFDYPKTFTDGMARNLYGQRRVTYNLNSSLNNSLNGLLRGIAAKNSEFNSEVKKLDKFGKGASVKIPELITKLDKIVNHSVRLQQQAATLLWDTKKVEYVDTDGSTKQINDQMLFENILTNKGIKKLNQKLYDMATLKEQMTAGQSSGIVKVPTLNESSIRLLNRVGVPNNIRDMLQRRWLEAYRGAKLIKIKEED